MLWMERRYHSLDVCLKTAYGKKIYKIVLDGGMTCPNRDGTLDTRGCIFCSAQGSGDFAMNRTLSITQQIEKGKHQSRRIAAGASYIAYFQAFTNTYAPPDYLRSIFLEAAAHPDIAIVSIATRPDCLDEQVLKVLCEVQKIKTVWVELGLQTIHEQTARFIRRGYPLCVFDQAVANLQAAGIPVIVHTILGLPGETKQHIFETVDYVCKKSIFGLKLQLLHVLKGTDLAAVYEKEPFPIYTQEEYTQLIVELLERIPPDIVIHRLTGDGPRDLLIEPKWSTAKMTVLNGINRELKRQDTWQGKGVFHEQGSAAVQTHDFIHAE